MYTILDLGKELKKLENFDKDEYIAKLEKEVARFIRNADLHVINHQKMYAELRATKHALWMARTERAFAERRRYCAMAAFNNIENDALRIKWFEIQWKCREKAKEFE